MAPLVFVLEVVRRATSVLYDFVRNHFLLELGLHVSAQRELFPANWVTSFAVRRTIVKVFVIGMIVMVYCVGIVVRERQLATETVEAVNHDIEIQVRAATAVKKSIELSPLVGGLAVEMYIKLKYAYPKLQNVSIFLAESTLFDDLANAPDPRKDYESYPWKGSLVGAVGFLEQLRYCPDLSRRYEHDQCSPFLDPRPGTSLRFLSIGCVPLKHIEELIGVLCVDSSEPGAFDDLRELRSLTTDHSVQQVAQLLWILRNLQTREKYCSRNPKASVCIG